VTSPKVSIVFPCYNEAGRLPRTLRRYLAHFPRDPGVVEVIVVDDGSTDATSAAALEAAGGDPRVRVLRTAPNHGKGFAVRSGILAAGGERVLFTDADGSYDPTQAERVLAALERAPVAIGARAWGLESEAPAATSGLARIGRAVARRFGTAPLLRRLASPLFNQALRLALGLPYRDTQCGLKGFRRQAAREIFGRARLDGFAFDAEALLLANRLGFEVVEVPVLATDSDGSKVRLAADALRMLADVWRVRRAAARGAYDEARVREDLAG
jgi:glycosyltransferase involved in cell wall biosynthesis